MINVIFKYSDNLHTVFELINGFIKIPNTKNLPLIPLGIYQNTGFVEYLLKRLKENPEIYLSSETLFTSFRTAVMNNSPNLPQYGEINNTGDEGGDFIFIRKKGPDEN